MSSDTSEEQTAGQIDYKTAVQRDERMLQVLKHRGKSIDKFFMDCGRESGRDPSIIAQDLSVYFLSTQDSPGTPPRIPAYVFTVSDQMFVRAFTQKKRPRYRSQRPAEKQIAQ